MSTRPGTPSTRQFATPGLRNRCGEVSTHTSNPIQSTYVIMLSYMLYIYYICIYIYTTLIHALYIYIESYPIQFYMFYVPIHSRLADTEAPGVLCSFQAAALRVSVSP